MEFEKVNYGMVFETKSEVPVEPVIVGVQGKQNCIPVQQERARIP